MKNAIELIRVSTEQQAGADRGGIPAQHEANKLTARVHGLRIIETIEIVDVSGASVLASPEMQRLLRLMESPTIEGVVAKEFSRLMRPDKFTDYALLQQFIDTNTILYLPEGPIDFASKGGRLMGAIRAALAGLERREITERMQDAKEALRRAGKHPGGSSNLPFGIGYSKERGWYFTPEIEKVKQAFALFISGETSYEHIGRALNISRTNVRFILENPIYTGWRVYDEKRDPSPGGYVMRPGGRQGYRRKVSRAPEDVLRVRVLDSIIGEDDFERVQRTIRLKREKHWRASEGARNLYTFHRFLTCGDCGNPLYTHTAKQEFYVCKTRNTREMRKRALQGLEPCTNRYMLRVKLEEKIDHLLGNKVRQPDFLKRLAEDYNEQIVLSAAARPGNPDRRAVNARLNGLKEKRNRVLEAFYDGVIDKQQRDLKIAAIDREVDAYSRILMETVESPEEQSAEALEEIFEPLAEWEFLERDDKRALLADICPEITVYRYNISSLLLNLEKSHGNGCGEDSRSKTGK